MGEDKSIISGNDSECRCKRADHLPVQAGRLQIPGKAALHSFLAGLLFVFSYGVFRLKEKREGGRCRVAVVQGNIAQEIKWAAGSEGFILGRYALLTEEAAKNNKALTQIEGLAFIADRLNEIVDRIRVGEEYGGN
jgi:hypothetical protein